MSMSLSPRPEILRMTRSSLLEAFGMRVPSVQQGRERIPAQG